jgi:uncharacterized protein (DUF433 family)
MGAMNDSVVQCSKDILSGTPVFRGTRVAVKTLLDYLEAGETVGDFLDDFPTVSKVQVHRFLEGAAKREIEAATP